MLGCWAIEYAVAKRHQRTVTVNLRMLAKSIGAEHRATLS